MHPPSGVALLSLALLARIAGCKPLDTFSARCEALATNLNIEGHDDITVTIAKYLPAGSIIDHVAEGLNETCSPIFEAPPLPANVCRLQLKVPTSQSSGVVMEAWLPETWSGRFLSTGNAGLGGCIYYGDIAYATSLDFAAVGTDNGHSGMSSGALMHQPERMEDFVYRGLFTGVVVGKSVTQQFYGKKHSKSYYFGCSSGGRQGWTAVQSFPDLFDGVVTGAPAIEFAGVGAWAGLRQWSLTNTTKEGYLDDNDWNKVQEMLMDQCDHLDGATDGILEDARQCKPDLEASLCKDENSTSWCLSPAQISTVLEMYKPLVIDGRVVHGGDLPGYDVRFKEALSLVDWSRYIVKEDPSYELTTFTIDDAREGLKLNPYNLRTFEGDISEFQKSGGKVLHWHGQTDDLLSITNSDRYYDLVSRTLGASNKELDDFYRYFRISGLNHCAGGPGANALGQGYGLAVSNKPDDNLLVRIVEWVEKGKAPEFVRGYKFVNDNPEQGVAFSRKHCKHPKVNHYFGKGNGTDESGWRCVEKE